MYMTWNQESMAVAVNALYYQSDKTTWVFPLVPLLPQIREEVQQQQIKAILICPEWTGEMWWPQLAALRTKMALIQFPHAEDSLSFFSGT